MMWEAIGFIGFIFGSLAAFVALVGAHANGRLVWTFKRPGRQLSDDELRHLDFD